MSLPTYYLVCFHEEATQEGVDFVAECLKKDVSEGGAELTIRQEDTTKNKWGGLILHVSATPERLYDIAESMDLKLRGEEKPFSNSSINKVAMVKNAFLLMSLYDKNLSNCSM